MTSWFGVWLPLVYLARFRRDRRSSMLLLGLACSATISEPLGEGSRRLADIDPGQVGLWPQPSPPPPSPSTPPPSTAVDCPDKPTSTSEAQLWCASPLHKPCWQQLFTLGLRRPPLTRSRRPALQVRHALFLLHHQNVLIRADGQLGAGGRRHRRLRVRHRGRPGDDRQRDHAERL